MVAPSDFAVIPVEPVGWPYISMLRRAAGAVHRALSDYVTTCTSGVERFLFSFLERFMPRAIAVLGRLHRLAPLPFVWPMLKVTGRFVVDTVAWDTICSVRTVWRLQHMVVLMSIGADFHQPTPERRSLPRRSLSGWCAGDGFQQRSRVGNTSLGGFVVSWFRSRRGCCERRCGWGSSYLRPRKTAVVILLTLRNRLRRVRASCGMAADSDMGLVDARLAVHPSDRLSQHTRRAEERE